MTENKKTFVPEHSGLGVTTTNLVPASLPEESKIAKVVVNMCQFGLRLDINRINFIKFFKQSMKKNKIIWGEANGYFDSDTSEIRAEILIKLANDFLKQAKPRHTIPALKLVSIPGDDYEASYGYEKHNLAISLKLTGSGFSNLNQAHIACVLYHEIRHADQVLLVTRFMLARGQNPTTKWINPSLITAAEDMTQSDTVQEGTGGKIIQAHRHYHCAVRLYASMFGDIEEEKQMTPNIYEEDPYKVPTTFHSKQRLAVKEKIANKKMELKAALENEVMGKASEMQEKARVMRRQGRSTAEINDFLEKELNKLSAPYNQQNDDYQNQLYRESLWEEKEAHETADPILEEYGTHV